MAVDMFGNQLDENGNPKKQAVKPAATLPSQDPNAQNSTVALSKDAMSGAANWDVNAGNTAVLGQAQQSVLNQPGISDLQKATTKTATDWVTNPTGAYDPAKAKQAALDRANADWAKTFEAQRQNFGNVSGSGLLQKDMLVNALNHNVDQATLAAAMDKQNNDIYQAALGNSIAAGNTTNTSNENIFSQRLGNAATVRGMAEGERAQETGFSQDMEKLDKTFGHEDAVLLSTQGWQSGEKALDRMATAALQAGDIEGQKEIAKLQQEFQNNQRIATQSWQTGERLGSEDATKASQYFDAEQKRLLQSNDIEGQKVLATLKNSFDLNLKTQDFAHDEKMAYLDNEYKTAFANDDVARQKDILSFTYNQDIAKMAEEFGFDTAKMQIQGNIQKALNEGDYAHADAMQEALFAQQSQEHDKDLAEQELSRKLQEKGMNYDVMMNAIETGAATAEDFNAILKAAGIDVAPIDPLASQKAIKAKMDDMKYEFLMTHPEYLDPNGNVDEGALRTAFNEYVNKANGTSADVATKIGDIVQNPANYAGSADPSNPKHSDYLMLKNSAKEFVPGFDKKQDLYQFKSAPAQNTAIMYGGNLLVVSGPVQVEKTSWAPNNQYFMATDVNTGQQVKIYANADPAKPYSDLGKYAQASLGVVGSKLVDIAKTSGKAIAKWLGF